MKSANRVLVVARLRSVQLMLSEVLRTGGVPLVVTARSSGEALHRCALGAFCVVVVDAAIGAPDCVGLLRGLRCSPSSEARRTPVLMLCDGTLEAVQAARSAGADAAVLKPVRPDALMTRINRLVLASTAAADRIEL